MLHKFLFHFLSEKELLTYVMQLQVSLIDAVLRVYIIEQYFNIEEDGLSLRVFMHQQVDILISKNQVLQIYYIAT